MLRVNLKKQREVLDPINTKTHPRNPPVEVKMDALHRCFELGESIKSVSEDIGYTRASIYALLLEKLNLAKSCYYYQENVLSKPDKYTQLCKRIREMFKGNKGRYGYRRIHGLLAKEVCTVSEKVVRRIMKQENLVVKIRKKRKYSSYKGEISPVNNNEHPIIIYVILATVHEMILDLK